MEMNIKAHRPAKGTVAEITADGLIITDVSSGTDLVGNLYFQGIDKVIIHKENILHDFFDLKTGIAGEILQKFSNYRIWLFIAGDFSQSQSKSLHDFVYECNNGRQVNFVPSVQEVLDKFS
jgi:hypothetical protein